MLCVVCYLPFVVYCALIVACCLSYVVCYFVRCVVSVFVLFALSYSCLFAGRRLVSQLYIFM